MTAAAPRQLTGRRVLVIAVAFFALVLAPNIVLMVTALRTFSGLVVPDSYIASQQFDRLRTAQLALGWTVAVDHAGDVFTLAFTDADGHAVRPAVLTVTLGRPTTTRDDEVLPLRQTPTGYAAAAPLAPGNWRVEIAAIAADGTAFRQSRDLFVRR